jgi:hypothetical protein
MTVKSKFMRATEPAPVLNTPHWQKVFSNPLPLDDQKLLRPVETVLLKGSLVKVVRTFDDHIVQVKMEEYPGEELYIDDRFLEPAKDLSERKKSCPSLKRLLQQLKNWPKTIYVWGGNVTQGVPKLAEYYPMPEKVDPITKKIWMLKGVDCSGLLYEATGGFLPRNTSELVNIGIGIPIANKSAEEIAKVLIPGDLIVWKGHVIIVEENGTVFESAATFGGTARTKLISRLTEIMKLRQPDVSFFVRRWHQDVNDT